MARPPHTTSTWSWLAGRAVAGLIRLVRRTSRIVYDPPDALERLEAQHPVIVAVWHGQFMMTSGFRPAPHVKVAAMVARHGDAEFIGMAMAHLGVELIRGAGAGGRRKDRGGAYALRQAVRALNEGASLVMTADVPPGPARRAGTGIVMLARLSGCPIVPVASATTRFIALDTWSRMTINLPFSKLAYVAGDPISVAADADEAALEAARARARAPAQRRDGARLRDCRRRHRARHAAAPRRPDGAAGGARPAPQDLPHRHEPAAADRARRPEVPRAQRQGGSAAAPRATRPADHAAPQRGARLGACGKRRGDQCRAAGDRGADRSPPAAQRAVDDGNRHVGRARSAPPGPALHPSIRSARRARVCGELPRALASRSRRVHRIGDLALAHPGDVRARHSHRPRQRAPVAPQPAPLAAQQAHGAAPVQPLRHRAGAERAPGARLLQHSGLATSSRSATSRSTPRRRPSTLSSSSGSEARSPEGRGSSPRARTRARRRSSPKRIASLRAPSRASARSSRRAIPSAARQSPSASRIWASRWRSARWAPSPARAPTSTLPTPSASSAPFTRCRPSPSSAARSSNAEDRTPSRPSATASRCSPARIGRISATPTRTLLRHKGAIEVTSAHGIAAAVTQLLHSQSELSHMRAGATQALATLSGALGKTVETLLRYLPDERLKRAS